MLYSLGTYLVLFSLSEFQTTLIWFKKKCEIQVHVLMKSTKFYERFLCFGSNI
jgi:hypothetical protein